MNNSHVTDKICVPVPGFDPEQTRAVFGADNPTLAQRTEYFFKKWREWWPNGFFLKNESHSSESRRILKDLGLVEFRDYQIRFCQIRFSDQTHYALAAVSDLQKYIARHIEVD